MIVGRRPLSCRCRHHRRHLYSSSSNKNKNKKNHYRYHQRNNLLWQFVVSQILHSRNLLLSYYRFVKLFQTDVSRLGIHCFYRGKMKVTVMKIMMISMMTTLTIWILLIIKKTNNNNYN